MFTLKENVIQSFTLSSLFYKGVIQMLTHFYYIFLKFEFIFWYFLMYIMAKVMAIIITIKGDF